MTATKFDSETISPGMVKEFLTDSSPEAVEKVLQGSIDSTLNGMLQAAKIVDESVPFYEMILSVESGTQRESFIRGITAAFSAIMGAVDSTRMRNDVLKEQIRAEITKYANQNLN